ncbi:wall-associated receptor kinase-like 9 [Bidens hawaiensis]|uniref:wall-associated receptor kinase-like 9 n=1 Tax=Bidens hawaiensis TaxID=980011 RepID=UPI004049FB7A
MKLFQAYHLLVLFSLTATTIAVGVPSYAKSGCSDMCGKVRIPYPFGIGVSCSLNRWFIMDCNSSTPYLYALSDLQVLRVNLENQTVTVDMAYHECLNPVGNISQIMSIDLASSPFLFSKSHNKFVFKGCGNAVMIDHGSHVLSECSSNCQNDTLSDCQMTVPHYLKSYNINITRQGGHDIACESAFLVDENSYVEGRFSRDNNNSYVPMSLLWTLSDGDMYNYILDVIDGKVNCYYDSVLVEVDLDDHNSMKSWKCVTYPGEGNPYLTYGHSVTKECARCNQRGKYCRYDKTYDPDGVFTRWNFTCEDSIWFEIKANKTSLGVILGISISMGVLFLVIISYLLYKFIKKTKAKRQRKRFFKRNGGLLLKQQEETDSSLVGKTILFTSRELEKATDNFNENRILGRGGQGTVYKGMLVDGRIVAIKKSKIVDESQLEQFINEVVILSQVNHRNVVRLLGCCLETNVPLLVSEFIQNGTLYDRLHNQIDELPFSSNMRLQIATEVAGALAYLHSATSFPIYHRDIKSTNILLDDKYRAKVSDFGTSRFVSIDQTHLTTLVKGTFGYLDPEYFQSSQFIEKSDVYSFGVVLVELLTGERPISLTRFGENRSLATHFMLAMEDGRVMSIFDATVIKEGTRNELLEIANLAMRCLNLNGKYRPTMKEVATELETMRTLHIPSTGQGTNGPMMYADDLTVLAYGESSSTFLSFNTNISQ